MIIVAKIFLILKILIFCGIIDFSPKIHIFLHSPLNNDPIFKVVQTMGTYIRGNITVAPDYLWPVLWEDTYGALKSLTECGMADDDQTLMLMAYRRHPENFELHMASYWGEGLGAYGGETLRRTIRRPKRFYAFHRFWRKQRATWKSKISEWKTGRRIKKRHAERIEKDYFSR